MDHQITEQAEFAEGQSFICTITGKTENGATLAYTYGATASGCVAGTPPTKPHAVTAAGSHTYTYNCNGDMTKRIEGGVTYTQTFNVENRLSVITSTAGNLVTKFYYDGDGARVKETLQIGTGAVLTTTLYVGAVEILSTTQRITRTYYAAGSSLIAMRVVTSTCPRALADYFPGGCVATGECKRHKRILRLPPVFLRLRPRARASPEHRRKVRTLPQSRPALPASLVLNRKPRPMA